MPWRGFGGRLLGLMGHPGLPPGQALVLEGDNSIHTLFMRFPIDVVFLDGAGRVKHLYHAMPPWRFSRVVFGSAAHRGTAARRARRDRDRGGRRVGV